MPKLSLHGDTRASKILSGRCGHQLTQPTLSRLPLDGGMARFTRLIDRARRVRYSWRSPAWLRRFADGTCDDLVLMTGEGLRRLLGFARRIDLESAFIAALGVPVGNPIR
jgi:hypothetical protein